MECRWILLLSCYFYYYQTLCQGSTSSGKATEKAAAQQQAAKHVSYRVSGTFFFPFHHSSKLIITYLLLVLFGVRTRSDESRPTQNNPFAPYSPYSQLHIPIIHLQVGGSTVRKNAPHPVSGLLCCTCYSNKSSTATNTIGIFILLLILQT